VAHQYDSYYAGVSLHADKVINSRTGRDKINPLISATRYPQDGVADSIEHLSNELLELVVIQLQSLTSVLSLEMIDDRISTRRGVTRALIDRPQMAGPASSAPHPPAADC